MLRFLDYSKRRLQSFLDQAAHLAESEFPYSDSRAALVSVEKLFKDRMAFLNQFDENSDPSVVKQECRLALESLFSYLPLLGFILRSTNVRNAFEAFAPIRRLAGTLLASPAHALSPEISLLLSSEWDYSPFVYDSIPALPHFLMIGLPAPESSNPLLLPLAGHELGHALWRVNRLNTEFLPQVNDAVIAAIQARWGDYEKLFATLGSPDDLRTSLFDLENWQPASAWALAQAQETFCDFSGLLLFGAGFLNAFAYLLSPALGRRSLTYPPLRDRAMNLVWAARHMGITTPNAYVDLFDPEDAPAISRRDTFRLAIADAALLSVREILLERAKGLIHGAGLTLPSSKEVNVVLGSFKRVVPAENVGSLVAILNAAWAAFHKEDLWSDLPDVFLQRDLVLRELTLKSLEILEFEFLTNSLT